MAYCGCACASSGHPLRGRVAPLVAYVSNETGANEVYLAELRSDPTTGTFAVGTRTRVSASGGFAPRRRADGRELFCLTTDGSVIAVLVSATNTLWIGRAEHLFRVPGVSPEWDVSHDGRRFLLLSLPDRHPHMT